MRPAAEIRRRLLRHYDAHARALPWRIATDPYRVWISEIMLQQTRVAAIEQRYERFVRRFPNVTSLASSRVEQVCEEWAGLGYYARARRLHEAARRVMRAHAGHLPEDVSSLRQLPGVGPYTAAAIASIAFGQRTPAIDGNVERVLARLLADSRVTRGYRTARLSELAAALVDCERPGDVNQALMDVGATICTPRNPRCQECPLRATCRGHALGKPERFPPPKAVSARRPLDVAFAYITTRRGVWLERRPLGGLWSGLWQLPGDEGPRARSRLAERLGTELTPILARLRHDLSHRRVYAVVYGATPPTLRATTKVRPYVAPLDAPLSSLARKALLAVAGRQTATRS